MLGLAMQMLLQGTISTALYLVLFAVIVLIVCTLEIRSLSKQLRRVERENAERYEKIRRESHGYLFCKNPMGCKRCRGWWFGFTTTAIAAIVGVILGPDKFLLITKVLGSPLTMAIGIAFAVLTPIHGSYGAMAARPSSFIESDWLHLTVGVLSGLSILFLTAAVISVF